MLIALACLVVALLLAALVLGWALRLRPSRFKLTVRVLKILDLQLDTENHSEPEAPVETPRIDAPG